MAEEFEEQPTIDPIIERLEKAKIRIAERKEAAFKAREIFIMKALEEADKKIAMIDELPQFKQSESDLPTLGVFPSSGTFVQVPFSGEALEISAAVDRVVSGTSTAADQARVRNFSRREVATFNRILSEGGYTRQNLTTEQFARLQNTLTSDSAATTGGLGALVPPSKSNFCGLPKNTEARLTNGDRVTLLTASTSDSCVYTAKNTTKDMVQVVTSGDIAELVGTSESDVTQLVEKLAPFPNIQQAVAQGFTVRYDVGGPNDPVRPWIDVPGVGKSFLPSITRDEFDALGRL